jgi:signal transduction histidine kinase
MFKKAIFLGLLCFWVIPASVLASRIDSLLQISKAKSPTDTAGILRALEAAELLAKTDRSNETLLLAREKLAISEQIRFRKGQLYAYTAMSVYYRYNNQLDSAQFFAKKALAFAGDKSLAFERADLYKKIGTVYFIQGATDSALFYYRKSLKTFELLNDSLQQFMLTVNMGAISQRIAQHDEAVAYFYKALRMAELLGDQRGIAVCYNNLANTLDDKTDYRGALKYIQKVIDIRRSLGDSSGVGSAYLNMGAYYMNLDALDSAQYCFQKSLSLISTKRSADHFASALSNMGTVYSRQGKWAQALDFMQREMRFREENQLGNFVAGGFGNMANLYFRMKDYPNAILYANKAVDAVQLSKELSVHKNAMRTLTESYLALGQTDKARQAFITFTELTDSLYRSTASEQVAEMQAKYETEKQQQENELLKQKIETEELRHEKALAKQNVWIVLGMGLGLVGLMAFLWRANAAKLKEKKLELQHLQRLQQEKERISRDLHDNVGGQLSFLLHSIDDLNKTETSEKEALAESINLSMRDVMGKLRETIWAIHQEEVSYTEFADKLKMFANSLFRHKKVQLHFDEQLPYDGNLPSMVALNLFRICQEILNNAFKHADASAIQLHFVGKQPGFLVRIADNGKGMDNTNALGHGLRNIQERAAENNIAVSRSSETGAGTAYELLVV